MKKLTMTAALLLMVPVLTPAQAAEHQYRGEGYAFAAGEVTVGAAGGGGGEVFIKNGFGGYTWFYIPDIQVSHASGAKFGAGLNIWAFRHAALRWNFATPSAAGTSASSTTPRETPIQRRTMW